MLLLAFLIMVAGVFVFCVRLAISNSVRRRRTPCPRCGRVGPVKVSGPQKAALQLLVGFNHSINPTWIYRCRRCGHLW